jgi:hypothetical protein
VPKQKISKAAEGFADAYRCYVSLFDEVDLRRFFCERLLASWADLKVAQRKNPPLVCRV